MDRWNTFIEILNILKIPYEATNTIQKASYTLSDFFACWLKIEYKLEGLEKKQNLVTDLAAILRMKLAERKKELFTYPAMMSAIYLDPRVRAEMVCAEELMIAKYKLEELYKKFKNGKNKMKATVMEMYKRMAKLLRIHSKIHSKSILHREQPMISTAISQ